MWLCPIKESFLFRVRNIVGSLLLLIVQFRILRGRWIEAPKTPRHPLAGICDYFIGAPRARERSAIFKKSWYSIHPKKFGSHVTVRPPARPPALLWETNMERSIEWRTCSIWHNFYSFMLLSPKFKKVAQITSWIAWNWWFLAKTLKWNMHFHWMVSKGITGLPFQFSSYIADSGVDLWRLHVSFLRLPLISFKFSTNRRLNSIWISSLQCFFINGSFAFSLG